MMLVVVVLSASQSFTLLIHVNTAADISVVLHSQVDTALLYRLRAFKHIFAPALNFKMCAAINDSR